MPLVKLFPGTLGGRLDIDGVPYVGTQAGDEGTVVYGPYEDRVPGQYRATFTLGSSGSRRAQGDPVCAILDVSTNEGQTLIAEKRLLWSAIETLGSATIDFQLHEPRRLEYRVHMTGEAGLNVAPRVQIEALPPAPPSPPAGTIEREWANEREFLDGFLRNVSGLIHVGANLGQERRYYGLFGIDVLWVEPIVETYNKLVDRIALFPRQRAVNALLSDKDGEEYEFQIANQGAGSSSLLPFEDHSELWPDIQYVESRKLRSTTLAALMAREGVTTARYQALTLDVEGAELMVLKGAGDLLKEFRYVKCEVADFPARTGTPTAEELDAFMRAQGFGQLMRRQFAMGPGNKGTYWDIVWKRIVPGEPLHEPGHDLPMVAHPLDVSGLEKCE